MRRPVLAAALAVLALVTAPAQAQRQSVVSVPDRAGDANGYAYADGTEVNGPVNTTTSDPRYDILRLTAVATSQGVRLTVRLAAPRADAGETVWVSLTPTESDCTFVVLVSDTRINGRPNTGLSDWCGQGALVNSVWREDSYDARADEPSAFVPYSAFPGTISTHASVELQAVVRRDPGGATAHVARIELDGVTAAPRLRLLGR